MIQFTQSQIVELVDALVDQNLTLRWFQNDVTPSGDFNASAFVEADFSGYSAQALTSANWDIVPGGTTIATYNTPRTVSADANGQDQNLYGIYITRNSDSMVVHYERFATARYINDNGDQSSYTPRIQITGQTV